MYKIMVKYQATVEPGPIGPVCYRARAEHTFLKVRDKSSGLRYYHALFKSLLACKLQSGKID